MTSQRIAIVLGCIALTACTAPAPFSFDTQLGVAAAGCMATDNRSLAPGSVVQLVNPMHPQKNATATIASADASCKGYRLSGVADPVPEIAVAGYTGAFTQDGDLLSADLDHDGQKEYFRACTSSEGVHLTVWTGRPLTGIRRWHRYHYLGYDVDPDCRPEDMAETK